VGVCECRLAIAGWLLHSWSEHKLHACSSRQQHQADAELMSSLALLDKTGIGPQELHLIVGRCEVGTICHQRAVDPSRKGRIG
jgi:hypothetical protein